MLFKNVFKEFSNSEDKNLTPEALSAHIEEAKINFTNALLDGDVALASKLDSFFPIFEKMDNKSICEIFESACKNGHLNVLKYLVGLIPNLIERDNVIHHNSDHSFRLAARNGHLEVLKYLVGLTPHPVTRDKMIHNQNDIAFVEAALRDHIEVMKYIIELTPDPLKILNMVNSNIHCTYKCTMFEKDLGILERLADITSGSNENDDLKHLIKAYAFQHAASTGDLKKIQFLLESTPNPIERVEMIYANNNLAFRFAAQGGHLEVFKYIIELTLDPIKQDEVIHDRDNSVFLGAAIYGHLEMLKCLVELTADPVKRDAMIHYDNDLVFELAAKYNHLEVLKYIVELTPDPTKRNMMVSVHRNRPIITALTSIKYIEMLDYLTKLISGIEQQNSIVDNVFSLGSYLISNSAEIIYEINPYSLTVLTSAFPNNEKLITKFGKDNLAFANSCYTKFITYIKHDFRLMSDILVTAESKSLRSFMMICKDPIGEFTNQIKIQFKINMIDDVVYKIFNSISCLDSVLPFMKGICSALAHSSYTSLANNEFNLLKSKYLNLLPNNDLIDEGFDYRKITTMLLDNASFLNLFLRSKDLVNNDVTAPVISVER